MKTNIALIAVATSLLFMNIPVQAEESQWPSVTVSSLVADKYMAFGTGSLLSKDPVIQSDVCISFKSGLYVDLWNSKSLNGSWDDGSFGNEVDYQVGWKGSITPSLRFNVGVTYFDEPNAFTFGAGDIVYTHAFLTRDFKHLSVTAGYENYVTMPGSGFCGGNLISLGVSKYQLFLQGKLGVRASVTGVYDAGTLGTRSGFIVKGSTGLDWNVSKRCTLNILGVDWYAPLTAHDKRVTDAVMYTGFTFHFN